MNNAVVLWTGGKDSFLALQIAQEQCLHIVGLATFVPVGNPLFQAHPQTEMEDQAKRLGLKIYFIEVGEPYKESYVDGLNWLKSNLSAEVAITGDIDYVDGCASWIIDCCERVEMDVYRPLWKRDREWIMKQLVSRNIQARISYINDVAIPSEWKGRLIDTQLIEELKEISADAGVDLTGENGEYHTMVVDAPGMAEVKCCH